MVQLLLFFSLETNESIKYILTLQYTSDICLGFLSSTTLLLKHMLHQPIYP